MSRMDAYEYDDYQESNAYFLWPSIIERALKGKRGQAVLKELEAALLELPEPKLIKGEFCKDGEVCALGALALKREIASGKTRKQALAEIEERFEFWHEDDPAGFAKDKLDLVFSMAWEVMGANERAEGTPEERFEKMLAWTRSKIKRETNDARRAR